ncbi:MAG: hypothetical protein HY719_00890 [Planctomycetes bacterium]|nr:hypothetical protein [Planctomycetota bacterium]
MTRLPPHSLRRFPAAACLVLAFFSAPASAVRARAAEPLVALDVARVDERGVVAASSAGDAVLAALAKLGVTHGRVNVAWTPAASPADLAATLSKEVARLRAAGLAVMARVVPGPRGRVSDWAEMAADNVNDWVAATRALAKAAPDAIWQFWPLPNAGAWRGSREEFAHRVLLPALKVVKTSGGAGARAIAPTLRFSPEADFAAWARDLLLPAGALTSGVAVDLGTGEAPTLAARAAAARSQVTAARRGARVWAEALAPWPAARVPAEEIAARDIEALVAGLLGGERPPLDGAHLALPWGGSPAALIDARHAETLLGFSLRLALLAARGAESQRAAYGDDARRALAARGVERLKAGDTPAAVRAFRELDALRFASAERDLARKALARIEAIARDEIAAAPASGRERRLALEAIARRYAGLDVSAAARALADASAAPGAPNEHAEESPSPPVREF